MNDIYETSILKQYSTGHITWREAASALGIEGFAAFQQKLEQKGFTLFEPDEASSRRMLDYIDSLLDEEP